jgi:hypothetical protein
MMALLEIELGREDRLVPRCHEALKGEEAALADDVIVIAALEIGAARGLSCPCQASPRRDRSDQA